MSVTFHFGLRRLRRGDCLECGLTINGVSVVRTVGGWHDGLQELIHAAGEMFGRAHSATATFQEEPGEYRWRLTRLADNRIRIRIIAFDDWATGLPDAAGTLLFDEPCGIVSFAKAIYEGSENRPSPERDRLANLLRQSDISRSD